MVGGVDDVISPSGRVIYTIGPGLNKKKSLFYF